MSFKKRRLSLLYSRVDSEARLKRDLFYEYDTTIIPNQVPF
jgi:hypothetical protein